jgi:hypothetical protein
MRSIIPERHYCIANIESRAWNRLPVRDDAASGSFVDVLKAKLNFIIALLFCIKTQTLGRLAVKRLPRYLP